MSTFPSFVVTPRAVQQQKANSTDGNDLTGATGLSGALAVGANGSQVYYILFKATTNTAAGLIRVYFSPDGGATKRLIAELVTPAATVSGTVPAATVTWSPPGGVPFPATAGSTFYFSFPANNETWNGILAGMDY